MAANNDQIYTNKMTGPLLAGLIFSEKLPWIFWHPCASQPL